MRCFVPLDEAVPSYFISVEHRAIVGKHALEDMP
jgi:hypothetical protein